MEALLALMPVTATQLSEWEYDWEFGFDAALKVWLLLLPG